MTPSDPGQIQTKKCLDCWAVMPLSFFGSYVASKDGHSKICKLCTNQYGSFNWSRKYPRKRRQFVPEIIRAVLRQNEAIIDQALLHTKYTCVAYRPHTDQVYKVIFNDPKYALHSMVLISDDAQVYKVFEYSGGDPAISKTQIEHVIKLEGLRLEFNELDMLNSKSQLYFMHIAE